MGKAPGKNNAGFLELLSATWTTVYGEQEPEPSWAYHIDSKAAGAENVGRFLDFPT